MRLVGKDEAGAVEDLLRRAPTENVFSRGTLRHFLRGERAARVWRAGTGAPASSSGPDGVVVTQVHGNCTLCVPFEGSEALCAGFVADQWARRTSTGIQQISGMARPLARVLPLLRGMRLGPQRVLEYARLPGAPRGIAVPSLVDRVRPIGRDELDVVERCYAGGVWSAQAAGRREAAEHGQVYILAVDGEAAAAAYVHPLLDDAGIVRAVYTPLGLRCRGYATALVEGVSRALWERGITPCLMYDDPSAGRIYHRLGYVDFGQWQAVQLLPA